MVKVHVVYHSKYGHTKLQAEAVHKGAASVPGVESKIYTAVEAAEHLDDFDDADGIIFGCPTYMGNISAGMKTFMEVAAKKWFTLAWKDKVAGVFTNSSGFSGDKVNTLVGLTINALQHGMICVGSAIMPATNEPEGANTVEGPSSKATNRLSSFMGAMSASFNVKPGDAPGTGDIETATIYGQRVAEVAVRLKKA